jgi:uncharacterized protein YdeI (YjbR/CyaY-like superfamily)
MSQAKVDAYIAKSAPFAQPILTEIRQRVHKACPAVEEAIKWGMPAFVYNGKILCGMAAFKQHASLGFWQRGEMAATGKESEAMGQFGKLTEVKQLPPKAEFTKLVKHNMAMIDAGAPTVMTKNPRPELTAPASFTAALKKNKKAQATFDGFPPSAKRDYVEWIVEAKTEATRDKRLAQAIEWMAEGKRRHWKYEKC